MRNTLGDLNNHLFAQLERLSDEELTEESLAKEINRSKAISQIANQVVQSASLVLQAQKFQVETYGKSNTTVPKMLEG